MRCWRRNARTLLPILLALPLLGLPARPLGASAAEGAPAHLASAATAQQPRARVTIGLLPVIPSATIFVPRDKGYFAEEGVEVDWEMAQATSEALTQAAAGHLDLAQATVGAAVLNAFSSGLDLRIVAGMHGMPPEGPGGDPIVVRKDLYDSGAVRDPAGLRGRKVAFNAPGLFVEYGVDAAMRTVGLTIDDVEIQTIPFPDIPAAFNNGIIDAAFLPEPFATQTMERGLTVQIIPDLLRGAQVTVLIAGRAFLQDRATAEAFMRGYLRGLRDLQRDGWGSPEHAAIIERYTRVPAATIQRILPQYADPDGRINWDSLMDQQRFYLARGYLRYTEPLDLLRWSDDGPRQAALQALAQ
ncbi:MAG: ABC transporter substrate-binding protein [Chloroflexi bacterium]|jgi:NitT/TauT family transport system substrate-binding protein|nr:ABC transporter substrate-binding protein [Chloroflexota bacterium]